MSEGSKNSSYFRRLSEGLSGIFSGGRTVRRADRLAMAPSEDPLFSAVNTSVSPDLQHRDALGLDEVPGPLEQSAAGSLVHPVAAAVPPPPVSKISIELDEAQRDAILLASLQLQVETLQAKAAARSPGPVAPPRSRSVSPVSSEAGGSFEQYARDFDRQQVAIGIANRENDSLRAKLAAANGSACRQLTARPRYGF